MKFLKLSDSQKKLAAVVFALAAGVSVLLTVKSINLHQPLTTTTMLPMAPVESASAKAVMAHVDNHLESQKASASLPLAIAGNQRASQLPAHSSWEMAGVKAQAPSLPLSERISDYAIVELPQQSQILPAVGELISLPMLHGKTLVAQVESSTTLFNGDYTWSGHLEGFGTDYPVVMTYGENSVFATITTPEGSYTMESINGLGWLYKNPAEAELSHQGAKDFLEIESH